MEIVLNLRISKRMEYKCSKTLKTTLNTHKIMIEVDRSIWYHKCGNGLVH